MPNLSRHGYCYNNLTRREMDLPFVLARPNNDIPCLVLVPVANLIFHVFNLHQQGFSCVLVAPAEKFYSIYLTCVIMDIDFTVTCIGPNMDIPCVLTRPNWP